MHYSTVFASHFAPLIYYNVNFLNRLFDPWLLSAGPTLPVRGCVPDSGRPCPCRLPRHCVRRRFGRHNQGHHRQRYSPPLPRPCIRRRFGVLVKKTCVVFLSIRKHLYIPSRAFCPDRVIFSAWFDMQLKTGQAFSPVFRKYRLYSKSIRTLPTLTHSQHIDNRFFSLSPGFLAGVAQGSGNRPAESGPSSSYGRHWSVQLLPLQILQIYLFIYCVNKNVNFSCLSPFSIRTWVNIVINTKGWWDRM